MRRRAQKQHLPYPNPIKLKSSDAKEIKGDYLNAEVMRKGIALPISDIRPSTNIQSEIFPRELTKEAQAKDVFTPPNHQQMRFQAGGYDEFTKPLGATEDGGNFFITGADVLDQPQVQEVTEEREEASQEETPAVEEPEEDEVFDFGKAKMDFFKQRARQILIEEQVDSSSDQMAYEGQPLQLKICY